MCVCVAVDEAAGRDSWLKVYCVFIAGSPRASHTHTHCKYTQSGEGDSNGILSANLATLRGKLLMQLVGIIGIIASCWIPPCVTEECSCNFWPPERRPRVTANPHIQQ